MNPRTAQVDYIYTTLDLLSVDAFDSGVRLTQWNESFTEWLPLFLTAEHFARARARFEQCIFNLCPHWSANAFQPGMVLDILPRLMNTMIVLLCDKGIEASERAINGYFFTWRLLAACVKVYDLEGEVQKRLEAFMDPENRHKKKVPSLGDFLPLLAACPNKAQFWWKALAAPILQESNDRSVLWACRDCPEFAEPEYNVIGEGVHEGRLLSTFQSTKVSKRLLMFHVHFLELVGKQKLDLFYGQTPNYMSQAFQKAVRSILEVDDWSGFFERCKQPSPDDAKLTDMLRQATHNSLRKGYHSKRTDFSRIHAHGVSHILHKGETYRVGSSVRSMRLDLGSDSSDILCGACLIYEDLICTQVVHYGMRAAYNNAVRHSGDQQVNGVSKHVIEVDLESLPASVTRLFFTLCACGCTDLSGFKNPAINLQDQDAQPMCTYAIEKAGRAPTVVMTAISRMPGAGWQVSAIGLHSAVRCCGNYKQVKRDITTISL
jgi:stress response protein SCP2